MYTISVGEISEKADPDWLVNFGKAVTNLQFGATQWGEWYEQAEHFQYEGAEVVGRQSEWLNFFLCFVKLYIVVLALLLMVLHTMYGVTFEEIKMLYLELYFGPRYFA